MREQLENTGFIPPSSHPLGRERRTTALAELLAIAALTLSTIVVAIVVTAGIAHADVVDGPVGHEASLFAVALLLGLIFLGIGGYSMPRRIKRR